MAWYFYLLNNFPQFVVIHTVKGFGIVYKAEGEVSQSCPTLCDPADCNLLGFSIHGILQARILEWIAISSSGIEPRSPALQADSLPTELQGR